MCSPEKAAQSKNISTFYVLLEGKQQGPYTLHQIRSMWSAGRLTVETGYKATGTDEWNPLLNMLSEIELSPKVPKVPLPPPPSKASSLQDTSANRADAQPLPNVDVADHADRARVKQAKYVLFKNGWGAVIGPLAEAEVIAECRSRKRVAADTLCARNSRLGLHTEWLPIREHPQFAPYVAPMTIDQERQAQHNAEKNPPPSAKCYLLRNGQQDGPFTPSQIRSMWKAGTIPSDTLYFYENLKDWRPVTSFCQNPDVTKSSTQSGLGVFLWIIGVALTVYFACIYDTSVDGGIVNLAKQQNRLIGIIIGVASCVIGVIMVLLSQKPKED